MKKICAIITICICLVYIYVYNNEKKVINEDVYKNNDFVQERLEIDNEIISEEISLDIEHDHDYEYSITNEIKNEYFDIDNNIQSVEIYIDNEYLPNVYLNKDYITNININNNYNEDIEIQLLDLNKNISIKPGINNINIDELVEGYYMYGSEKYNIFGIVQVGDFEQPYVRYE